MSTPPPYCCITNKNFICDGKYYKNSPACKNIMIEYCSKGDNIINDYCKDFCRDNKLVECDDAMIAYCKRQKEKGKSPELCKSINLPKEPEPKPKPELADDEPDDVIDTTEEKEDVPKKQDNDYTWIYVTLVIIVALIIIAALGFTGIWFMLI